MRRLESALLSWIGAKRALPIQLDITNTCNLRCTHCYHPHHRNDAAIGLDDWKRILDQYQRLIARLGHSPFLIICGGEPLTSPNLRPVLDHAAKLGLADRLMILTNGTLVERIDLTPFRAFSQTVFQISIDGPTAETHDAVRGRGAFDAARRGASRLLGGGFEVQLQCTLSKRSAADIPRFFEAAQAWDVHRMEFTRLIPVGRAASMEDRPLLPVELKEAYARILECAARTGVKTSTTLPLMHLLHPAIGASGRFADGIVIDYRGNLLASSRSRLVLGNVLAEGLEALFLRHPVLKAVRSGRVRSCGECPHFRRCGGDRNAAYAATGDFLGPDPGCWISSENPQEEGEVA